MLYYPTCFCNSLPHNLSLVSATYFEGYHSMSNISMTTSKRNAIVTVMLISAFCVYAQSNYFKHCTTSNHQGLNITETTAQWLITGFMLVNGIMIPLTAFLMDKYSTRHLYIFSMAIFLIGSIVAAF